jgi:hypothetical protein
VAKLLGVFDKPRKRIICRLADLLDELDEQDRAALGEAVYDDLLAINYISDQVTKSLGETFSRSVITRHRTRPCPECVRRGYVFARQSES